ncbi:MAG: NTP transferase domain-containing protein [Candidatus Aegiribacteria sp.]|nr:NTP transferase domain-containing protein [Candidatus Aegiribacteria sp.]
MHAIIPVAGKGTRLRPHTWSTPKPLLQVAGKPILGHIMDRLASAGIVHVTLIVGYLGDMIVEWTRKEYPDIHVDFAKQDTMDGLASAVDLAAPMTGDGMTFVVLGDTIFSADLSQAADPERNMIAVKRVDDPSRFGVVLMKGEKVVRLVEKPEEFISDLAIVGIYGFSSGSVLMNATSRLIKSGNRTRGEYQLTDAMQLMLDEGHDFGVFKIDEWFDCGKPETFLETNRNLLDSGSGENRALVVDSVIIPPVSLPEGVVISASIVGPHVSIGCSSRVENSIISNTVIGKRSSIDLVNIRDSIIGDDVAVSGKAEKLDVGNSSTIEL